MHRQINQEYIKVMFAITKFLEIVGVMVKIELDYSFIGVCEKVEEILKYV